MLYEGLNVTISDFAGGSQALRAVVGGSADVVSGAYEHTLNMQPKGQYLQCFVQQGRAPQIAIGIASARAKDYKSPKDLKGLKVGVSAPGSSTHMILNHFISTGGLKPSDISVIGVGLGGTAITALKSGQIDAVSNTDPQGSGVYTTSGNTFGYNPVLKVAAPNTYTLNPSADPFFVWVEGTVMDSSLTLSQWTAAGQN